MFHFQLLGNAGASEKQSYPRSSMIGQHTPTEEEKSEACKSCPTTLHLPLSSEEAGLGFP